MIDKFSQALTLMREAFADAQVGAAFLPCVDVAAQVDGAQQVINAASAVQALRVAQYAAREQEQDGSGVWVEVDHGLGHVSEFAADCLGRCWRWDISQPGARSPPPPPWPPSCR